MANPDFLNVMGEEMGNVYAAVHDRLLINLARHFKYVKEGKYEKPGAAFQYQAQKLAEVGQVNRESVDIIMNMMGGGDKALRETLEAAILDALANVEPELRRAAEAGLLNGGIVPAPVDPTITQAFQSYYRQSADKLNLVNTVMLESTQEAYRATVSDIVNRMRQAQRVLNAATGEVISGAESFNQALRLATARMVENGITGFIDHSGRRWAPEVYVAMDMRTTYHNASRAAFWERNQDYTNDLYLVSQHPGARPLCYPWQCKVISRTNNRRWEKDGDGQPVQVWAQDETSYGEPAGLFGINCGHYPLAFIPGVTKVPEVRQDEEQNAKQYAESQQQRALEREFRQARLALDVAKAQGADKEEISAAKQKIAEVDGRLDQFCEETGRKRRREREYAPVNAKWPDPTTYDAKDFPTATRDALREYFQGGGAQGKALTDGDGSGTIYTKLDADGRIANPMNVARYETMRDGIERQGIRVIKAKDDDLRYLEAIGAEATYGNGYIMHRGEIPSASGMFEETIHMTQARIYGETTSSDLVELAAREIAAQHKLLDNGKAYGFSDEDYSDIRINLDKWDEEFRKLTGKEYDPNDRESPYYRGF